MVYYICQAPAMKWLIGDHDDVGRGLCPPSITTLEITDTTSLKSQDPLFAAGGRDSWFSPCNVLNDRRCCGVCDVRI